MAWTEYDPPNGNDVLQLYIRFLGGNAIAGVMMVQSMDNPTEEQYQALIDTLQASPLIQLANMTDTVPVTRTLTATPIPPGDDS